MRLGGIKRALTPAACCALQRTMAWKLTCCVTNTIMFSSLQTRSVGAIEGWRSQLKQPTANT
eukprot:4325495-Lingulodinium_polyedra.AAC.1